MDKTRAAKIWAKLERALVGQLMSGSQLDIKRPYLIRLIGDQLEAENVDVELPSRAAAAKSVSPPLPERFLRSKTELDAMKSELAINRRIKDIVDDTIHDAKLAAMLERSCSRRMGYDGDDPVGYGEH